MNTQLKVGIAGYGVVGKRRRHFIDQHSALKTVAVCDRTLNGNGTFEDGVRYYARYDDLIREEDLDILFVCLTNDVAAHATISGLENGLHVFCEKPPARNLVELSQVLTAEKKFPHLKLKYGFNHRYHDSVRYALQLVQGKELGELINLRGVYGKSQLVTYGIGLANETRDCRRGILLDQGIHMVDMMRLFAGEFKDIYSFISNSYWHHDVEDNAYALMRTKSGTVAMLHSSATQWRHRFYLELSLSRGSITLAGILSGSKSYGEETVTIAYLGSNDQGTPREQTLRYNEDNSWWEEISEFADLITRDKPVLNGSSAEAYRTMELVYRIYEADKEWGTNLAVPPIPSLEI